MLSKQATIASSNTTFRLVVYRGSCLLNEFYKAIVGFPVAQMVEHGTSNAKIMGSIPRESKSW